jgi:DNA-directed RNA polymerase specialized sigma24 family protein
VGGSMSGIGKLKGACGRCKKHDTCQTLCARVEKYVDQDHVNQRERRISIPAIQNGLLRNCQVDIALTEWHDIECLSALDNKIFRLKHVGLLTFNKIAQIVRKKAATCRKRYSRAREKFDEFMQNGGKAFSDVG